MCNQGRYKISPITRYHITLLRSVRHREGWAIRLARNRYLWVLAACADQAWKSANAILQRTHPCNAFPIERRAGGSSVQHDRAQVV